MTTSEGVPAPTALPPPTTPFARRLWRAAMLDACLYEEVEADRAALLQAAAVVFLASLAAGIGSFPNSGWTGIATMTVAAFVGWVGWATITYCIGVWLLPGAQTRSDPGELLRTIGFSAAPGVFAVLGVVPGANPWVFVAVGGWLLTAMVIALRQALDYCTTLRAIAVCAIGLPLSALLLAIALLFTGPWPF